jgi:predicted kinase
MVGCPRWLEPLLHRMSPKGRRMARPGWRPLLSLVIGAFRGLAAGLRLTLDELAAETGAGRRTCARYVRELVEAGLVRRVHVFQELQIGERSKRANDSNIYQPGPVLLAHWHALLEGCSSRVKWGGPSAKRARFAAHELRQEAKQHRRARELAAREQHPAPQLEGKLRRPNVEGPKHDATGEGADEWLQAHANGPGFDSAEAHAAEAKAYDELQRDVDELEAGWQREEMRRFRSSLEAKWQREDEESAKRSCVGPFVPAEPDALAAGPGPGGDGEAVSLSKCQGGPTTPSRSENATQPAPMGPGPAASASGSAGTNGPTHERFALGRSDGAAEPGSGSRSSHSFERDAGTAPGPLAGAQIGPDKPTHDTTATPTPGAVVRPPLGALPPAPRDYPEAVQRRQSEQRRDQQDTFAAASLKLDGQQPPATGPGYDWREAVRKHAQAGGKLHWLDARMRAELGLPEDD